MSNIPGLLLSDLLFNLRTVLTVNRDFPDTCRSIRTEGDYKNKFGPITVPQPAAPSHLQPRRQRGSRVQPGNVVVASASTDHIGLLKKADKEIKVYPRLVVEVEEIVSENVVRGIPLNNTDIGRVVLKFFPADSARMLREILAYNALQPIQGSTVPQFIGVFTVDSFSGYVLGLCAVDGVTLREHFETEAASIELFRLVWSQLCAVHDCGVAQMDVRVENIIIKHDRSVVIIDFDNSL